MKTFKELTDYFLAIGADGVGHSTKTYLAHAIGVYNDLKDWGCEEELARVGLFHSIYGTAIFQNFTLSLERRGEVRELIGDRAERLSWLNCAIDRRHFDAEVTKPVGPYSLMDRFTDSLVSVSDDDFRDLCTVHLCDWLEQVERSHGWDYRRTAYRDIAERLGGVALERYTAVFVNAPKQKIKDEYSWADMRA